VGLFGLAAMFSTRMQEVVISNLPKFLQTDSRIVRTGHNGFPVYPAPTRDVVLLLTASLNNQSEKRMMI
jgi:hypothetical protein